MDANEILQEQFLTFYLAADEYAVPVLRVKEILEYQAVTRVPHTPFWVRGVFNLRGSVIPVIDLAVKLGMNEAPITKTSCIIILEVDLKGEPLVIGVVVNSVSQVVDLTAADVQPVPDFGVKVNIDYLRGIVNAGSRLTLLIDIDRIFSVDELSHIGNTHALVSSEPTTAQPAVAQGDAL
ncbi:MAG TPA: chemotaxis protein CheW [Candidatus Angelobacter sp.]